MKREVKRIITQLKRKEMCIKDIPEEYRDCADIVSAERKLGLRKTYRCGYDIIKDRFFVKEEILYGDENAGWSNPDTKFFDDFNAYCTYLGGNVYENACYYQLDPKKIPEGIDKNRLLKRKSFIEATIDDYTLLPSRDELIRYANTEKIKVLIKRWIEKFNKCTTFQQLERTVKNYSKSLLSKRIEISFYFWNYIFKDVNDSVRFRTIMEYVSADLYSASNIIKALCAIYDPDEVVENYKYKDGDAKTNKRRIRELKQCANRIINDEFDCYEKGFFDDRTDYYCVETEGYYQNQWVPEFSFKEYFESITEFVKRREGDLTWCDLSKAPPTEYDFSKCKTDKTTRLPINVNENYDYSIKKYYQKGLFKVEQVWQNKNGNVVKEYNHQFDYFGDFVAFLKGDLSGADLITCDGLSYVIPTDSINLKNALITSNICESWDIPYDPYEIKAPSICSFDYSEQNEKETAVVLQSSRELMEREEDTDLASYFEYWSKIKRVFYLSDIHLYHLIRNKKAVSKTDIIKIIRRLISTIIDESEENDIILINGDTSLDFSLFQLFVSELGRYQRTVIFTLGNHEIWSCPQDTLDQLSEKYRGLLQAHEMYLLQNDVLFFNEFGQLPERINEKEINDLTEEELKERVRYARLIFFGGIGFAGYNQYFNAKSGLYQYNQTIGYSRNLELMETRRFEALYKKICKAFDGKTTVILTHMPLPDWYEPAWHHKEQEYSNEMEYRLDHPEDNVGDYSAYHPGFIYVSGHTHRNYYYDDGEIRIYADNQFGYNNSSPNAWPHLKYFEVEKEIDCFYDYKDGIYEISVDEYRKFYRCKNIHMEINRETNIIYMLKKNGYYCFVHKAKDNNLTILNGGTRRRLDRKDIRYYYDNMDYVIVSIKDPLDKYSDYQKKISDEIKRIGGDGSIHGCIVDIDFYNHVYVNPADGTLTGYWASDIINKIVYPSILSLLEEKCPGLFITYKGMTKEEIKKNLPAISGQTENQPTSVPVLYLDTDIYKASRQIRKMQKLSSDILTIWPDEMVLNKVIKAKRQAKNIETSY